MKRIAAVAVLAAALSGCYHATVELPSPAAPQRTESLWAHSWVYGLVPPSTVNAAEHCPSGASRVETQVGVPHMLVSWITFGIYTPMQIQIQCAAP